MALQAFLDTISISPGSAGTTIARTVYGHQPKVLVVWGGQSISATDVVLGSEGVFSIGFALSTTKRRMVSYRSSNSSAAADTAVGSRSDAVAGFTDLAGAGSSLLDVSSIDADGWTAIVDGTYSTARKYGVLSLGGGDITNVELITVTAATSGATQDITTVGFQGDSFLVLGSSLTAESGGTGGRLSFGVVAGTNATDNAVLGGLSQDAADPTVTKSYCRRGESFVGFNTSGGIDGRGYISAVSSNGFTITWNSNPSDAKIFYVLAIKGGRFSVGDVLTQTDTTTDIVESGVAFQPVAGLLLSACKAESAAGTVDDGMRLSIGAFTSASAETAHAIHDRHNLATSDIRIGVDYDACYLNIGASAQDGNGHITAVNSDGYTGRMTDADPSQAFVAHLLFGSAASGSNANLFAGKFGAPFIGKL